MLIQARFVVPVEGPVVEDGAVLIEGGRIRAVGRASDLHAARSVDYGDAAVLPGLVNAHTHLELSHLAGRLSPARGFIAWLRALVAELTESPPTEDVVRQSVESGVRQSVRAGVTTLGDISRFPFWSRPAVAGSPVRCVSFGEVAAIGKRRHLLNERLAAAVQCDRATERLRIGVSPHSPYTVEPDGLRTCARTAGERKLPLAIHLAETKEESEFTRTGGGPLAAYLRDLQVWDDDIPVSGLSPIELAVRTGVLGRFTVAAHLNYIDDTELARLAQSGTSVAYCPRTHAAFGHEPHPVRRMLDAGINVCIGTDSLASNPSLSVLDELRFLRAADRRLPPEVLLALATVNGAKALGMDGQCGSLVAGKQADLAVMPLPRTSDPWHAVLDEAMSPVAVYIGGDICHEPRSE